MVPEILSLHLSQAGCSIHTCFSKTIPNGVVVSLDKPKADGLKQAKQLKGDEEEPREKDRGP